MLICQITLHKTENNQVDFLFWVSPAKSKVELNNENTEENIL